MLLHLITVKRLAHLFDTARPLSSRPLPFRKLSGLSGREHYPRNVLPLSHGPWQCTEVSQRTAELA
jgi:hypothetical protein